MLLKQGFLFASPDDFWQYNPLQKKLKQTEVWRFGSCDRKRYKTTWDAVSSAQKPRIHTFIATSPVHGIQTQKKPEEVLELARNAVRLLQRACAIELIFLQKMRGEVIETFEEGCGNCH